MFTSARPLRRGMKSTGCRPSPAKAGTSSCASTARSNRSSTKPGVRVRPTGELSQPINQRKNTIMKTKNILAAALLCALAATTAFAANAPKMKMTTDIPPSITTPDSVPTSIGMLKFTDGLPDDKTTQLLYDNLDLMRGVQAFLRCIPGASVEAFMPAAKQFGGVDGNVMIFEDKMDSKSLWLTPNHSCVYFHTWLDLTKGPIVMETPPGDRTSVV